MADQFRSLPEQERLRRLSLLSDAEIDALFWDWQYWSRPEQQLPPGDWVTWLILAGRGFGKSRTGAETVREWVKTNEFVNLIGPTLEDVRVIMVEGESGILRCCPPDERPQYVDRELRWPNGAISLIFTADEPERLRGKQHMKLWCDELCAWRYPEAWDQAQFGLRIGRNPQAIVTTTPKPTKELKELMRDPTTIITRGSTYDNKHNLAAVFLNKIISKYEGTRLGRQELKAEVLEDNPGALWKRSQIDKLRVKDAPVMKRIVVAIDPSASANPDSDECGITVEGLGADNHGYVLEDLSFIGTPEEWAHVAVQAYHRWNADRIIAEKNNGGLMVETVIRIKDKNVPIKLVHASKGKFTRAEPISALYEQGKVHHVGSHPQLEDQMCDYDPKLSKYSPDRMDSLVWGLTELMAEYDVAGAILDFYSQQEQTQNER